MGECEIERPLTLSPEELAYNLRDEGRGKYSMGSLTWLQNRDTDSVEREPGH